MALIEDIKTKCAELDKATQFLNTLAGKATDPQWVIVDPGYAKLIEMGKTQADLMIAKAQEIRALLPP